MLGDLGTRPTDFVLYELTESATPWIARCVVIPLSPFKSPNPHDEREDFPSLEVRSDTAHTVIASCNIAAIFARVSVCGAGTYATMFSDAKRSSDTVSTV